MRKVLLAGCILDGLGMATMAQAQTQTQTGPVVMTPPDAPVGKEAGAIMVRLRAIGVLPQNWDSSVSGIGGHVEASYQAAPEIDVSYFFTDNIAVEAIAASTRHKISVSGSALGRVDVGSVWVLPPTVTAQYHFMPKERFSPYIGAGINFSFFYNTHGNAPLVRSFALSTGVGPAIQAGFDYNFSSRWFLNFDVKQIFMRTSGDVHTQLGTVKAKTWLNPTVVGMVT